MIYQRKYQKREHYEYVSDSEMDELFKEIRRSEEVLLYGAGKVAKAVLKCFRNFDMVKCITQIVVSDIPPILSEIDGIEICGIDQYVNKTENPLVLIATREDFHEEIFCKLKDKRYDRVVPLSQLHINRIGEYYFRNAMSALGIDLEVLELINIKRVVRDYYTNKFNNMCDIVPNIKTSMFKVASEETAKYVMEHMMNVKNYETRDPMHYDALKKAGEGLYLEFGVAAGGSINGSASIRKEKIFYGFDSFEGLPEDWNVNATGFGKGSIRQSELPDVRENVRLIKGYFNETLPGFLEEHKEKCAYIHMDCDLYSSTHEVLELLHDRIVTGTQIVFDDYFNFPGWQDGEHKALMEFADKYGVLFRYTGYTDTATQVSIEII